MNLPIHYPSTHFSIRKKAREQYIKEQNNLCHHCNLPLDSNPIKSLPINESLFPPNFMKWPVHLHHDHDSGMSIGAVHAYCNAVLWQYYNQ